MMARARYAILVLVIIAVLHFTFSYTNEGYGNATSISNLKNALKPGKPDKPPYKDPVPDEYYVKEDITSPQGRRANATFVLLARNSDLNGVVTSMKQMEDRFNKKFRYPYVFLNEEPFSDEFKERVSRLTDADIKFGLIPHDHWYQPSWIDEEKAKASREDMVKNNVIYGGSVPYVAIFICSRLISTLLKPAIEICADSTQDSSGETICSKSTNTTGVSSEESSIHRF
ncbi:hypothetical protein E1B28_008823 [Marasmius oreades]|uniref:Glycosyltransferase family 15 protein n=1 Tax=Marasmius oreades TaxID=181124 RepID=A0A9P7RZ64_9AGAR|nr:uncharacterized protein E1B28_008823 [Marasmius oreades]KAG7092471.1 hypothetical protein E1B28_008823 [Marasmius oreades]